MLVAVPTDALLQQARNCRLPSVSKSYSKQIQMSSAVLVSRCSVHQCNLVEGYTLAGSMHHLTADILIYEKQHCASVTSSHSTMCIINQFTVCVVWAIDGFHQGGRTDNI